MNDNVLRPFIVVCRRLCHETIVRKEYLVSRMALGYSLAMSGMKTEILKNNKGAPLYKNGVYWSLTHKEFVGAGVASNSAVGIDVEIICPVDPGFGMRTAEEFEWDILGGYSILNFYRNWTAKEALLKLKKLSVFRMSKLKVVSDYGKKIVLRDEAGNLYVISFFIEEDIISAVTLNKHSVLWRKKVF